MNPPLDLLARRLMAFALAVLGTFALYLSIGELTGTTAGTPFEVALSAFVARTLTKATVLVTGGHAIALVILMAPSRRGIPSLPLHRSAMAGVACATALDMAYVSGTFLSGLSTRGSFRLVLATVISLAILARRARRPDSQPRSVPEGTAGVAQPEVA